MNQEQFDLIVKIIRRGAPALADELVQSLVALVASNAKMERLLTQVKDNQPEQTDTETTDEKQED